MAESNKGKRSKGYTLVELIVSVTVFMIIFSSILLAFESGIRSIVTTIRLSHFHEGEANARMALLRLTREARMSYGFEIFYIDASGNEVEITASGEEPPEERQLYLRFSMPAAAPGNPPVIVEYSYFRWPNMETGLTRDGVLIAQLFDFAPSRVVITCPDDPDVELSEAINFMLRYINEHQDDDEEENFIELNARISTQRVIPLATE